MNNKAPELWLRPHHLLCLQSFVGHGYSEEFVQQMSVVKQQLTDSPDTPVKIVQGADMLCLHCPTICSASIAQIAKWGPARPISRTYLTN